MRSDRLGRKLTISRRIKLIVIGIREAIVLSIGVSGRLGFQVNKECKTIDAFGEEYKLCLHVSRYIGYTVD